MYQYLFYWNSWNFICYCTQLILGNVSIFKAMPLPTADPFPVNSWIWNVTFTPLISSNNPTLSPRPYRWFHTSVCFICQHRSYWHTVFLQLNIWRSCLYSWWKQNGIILYKTWLHCLTVHLYCHTHWKIARVTQQREGTMWGWQYRGALYQDLTVVCFNTKTVGNTHNQQEVKSQSLIIYYIIKLYQKFTTDSKLNRIIF
jgi:hypothetical protein